MKQMKKLLSVLISVFFIQMSFAQSLDSLEVLHKEWIEHFNTSNFDKIASSYLKNGAIFYQNKMYQNNIKMALKDISKKSLKNASKITSHQRLFLQKGWNEQHYFEMVNYQTSTGQSWNAIIAWKYQDGYWQRELDIVDEKTTKTIDYSAGVDVARKKWIALSNAHQVEQLVKEVYANNALYFNRGEITTGQDIIKRYSYMSGENWKIDLFPKCVTTVREDLIFEIGEYKSPGTGHYVLIWKKIGKNWKVVLDFNF